MAKRRIYSPEFKTKVALSVIRGDGTISELFSRYGINANLIFPRKQEEMDSMKTDSRKAQFDTSTAGKQR